MAQHYRDLETKVVKEVLNHDANYVYFDDGTFVEKQNIKGRYKKVKPKSSSQNKSSNYQNMENLYNEMKNNRGQGQEYFQQQANFGGTPYSEADEIENLFRNKKQNLHNITEHLKMQEQMMNANHQTVQDFQSKDFDTPNSNRAQAQRTAQDFMANGGSPHADDVTVMKEDASGNTTTHFNSNDMFNGQDPYDNIDPREYEQMANSASNYDRAQDILNKMNNGTFNTPGGGGAGAGKVKLDINGNPVGDIDDGGEFDPHGPSPHRENITYHQGGKVINRNNQKKQAEQKANAVTKSNDTEEYTAKKLIKTFKRKYNLKLNFDIIEKIPSLNAIKAIQDEMEDDDNTDLIYVLSEEITEGFLNNPEKVRKVIYDKIKNEIENNLGSAEVIGEVEDIEIN